MSSHLVFENILNNEDLSTLLSLLELNDDYITNKDIRASKKIEYNDDIIFNWIEKNMISVINNKSNTRFHLIKSKIELIKCKNCDLKNYNDEINIESDYFGYYTLLLSLNGTGSINIFSDNHVITVNKLETNVIMIKKNVKYDCNDNLSGFKCILKCHLLGILDNKEYLIVNIKN